MPNSPLLNSSFGTHGLRSSLPDLPEILPLASHNNLIYSGSICATSTHSDPDLMWRMNTIVAHHRRVPIARVETSPETSTGERLQESAIPWGAAVYEVRGRPQPKGTRHSWRRIPSCVSGCSPWVGGSTRNGMKAVTEPNTRELRRTTDPDTRKLRRYTDPHFPSKR